MPGSLVQPIESINNDRISFRYNWDLAIIDNYKIKECNATTNRVILLPKYFEKFGYKTFHIGDKEKSFQEHGRVYEKFGPKPKTRFKYDPAWFGKPSGTSTDRGAYPDNDSLMPDYKYASWLLKG